MRQFFRQTGAVLALQQASAHKWQIARGVFISPEGKCPFCSTFIRSSQLWKVEPGKLKGRWEFVGSRLVFIPPNRSNQADHPHVCGGDVCLGRNSGDDATATALFLGMNPGGSSSPWGLNSRGAPDTWREFLEDVWDHPCRKIDTWFEEEPDWIGNEPDEESCDVCQHGTDACGAESPDEEYECDRYQGHHGWHAACNPDDGSHYVHEWPRTACNCAEGVRWCGNPNGNWVCSRPHDHAGQHRACSRDSNEHQHCPDWGEIVVGGCTEGARVCEHHGRVCAELRMDWECTRVAEHDGPHIACGFEHNIETWETERNEPF